ncbi:hydroxymethylbilane synthase [Oceanobacillus sp. CAU 1775]
MHEVIMGTRGSKLAVRQTEMVVETLKQQNPGTSFQIKKIETEGDKKLDIPLAKMKRGDVFLGELEEQLLEGKIDFAVHSLKDVPLTLPEGLTIAAIPHREDHRDVYIANNHISLEDLPPNASIGTSSLRRSAQILAKRPDLKTEWIRGPIDSRIEQLQNGNYDAIILAMAGIKRLGLDEGLITEILHDDEFVPAMGQGALAIECREDDEATKALLATIHDEATAKSVTTERLFLRALDEDEKAPIGAYATVSEGVIHLFGMVISLDGQTVLTAESSGKDSAEVARDVANALINHGAMEIVANAKMEIQKR